MKRCELIKLGQSAALGLVGWYLVAPLRNAVDLRLRPDPKLSYWDFKSSHDTAIAREAARHKVIEETQSSAHQAIVNQRLSKSVRK
jgi:hypothetical protein